MKKKPERLENISEIARAIKNRSRALKGLKDVRVRNKIATIWYLESGQRISSYLVDEVELTSILHNHLTEILCIQVFMGAYYLKGNGVFEHRQWVERNGNMKNITYELVDPIGSNPYSVFTNNAEKLVVTERQHAVICAICKYICKQTRMMTGAKVSNLIFQVVFSSAWVPYVVSCRKFSLEEASDMFVYKRDAMVYATGEMPILPNFNPNSLMLPTSWAASSPQKLLTSEQKQKIHEHERQLHQFIESQRPEQHSRKQAAVLEDRIFADAFQRREADDTSESGFETSKTVAPPFEQRSKHPLSATRISNLTMDSALMNEAVATVYGNRELDQIAADRNVEAIAFGVAAAMELSIGGDSAGQLPHSNGNTNGESSDRLGVQQPHSQRPSRVSMRRQSTASRGSVRHSGARQESSGVGFDAGYSRVTVARGGGEIAEYAVPNADTSRGPSLLNLQKDVALGEVDTRPFGEAAGRVAVRRRVKSETAELEKRKEAGRRRKQQFMLYRPESAHTIATLRMLGGKPGQSVEGRLNSAFALIKDLEESGGIDRDFDEVPNSGDVHAGGYLGEEPSRRFTHPAGTSAAPHLVTRTVAFTSGTDALRSSRRYEEQTESSEMRVNSFAHQLFEPYVPPPDPRLAPSAHTTGADGAASHESHIPKELLPPPEDEPLPLSQPPVKGFAFQKSMAGTAKQCFGCYCGFGRRAKVMVELL